jgi:hypothetical protein
MYIIVTDPSKQIHERRDILTTSEIVSRDSVLSNPHVTQKGLIKPDR